MRIPKGRATPGNTPLSKMKTIYIRNQDGKRLDQMKKNEGRAIAEIISRALDLYEKSQQAQL